MPNSYIPSKGASFRLLGLCSDHVLTANQIHNHNALQISQISHHPRGQIQPGQWFQIIPGRGQNSGYSALKHKATGKVLFSTNFSHPRVGLKPVAQGGQLSPECWFKFDFGSGKHKNHFRICNYATNTILYSRTHTNPQVYNLLGGRMLQKADEQYFSFLLEDMRVDSIEYDIDAGQMMTFSPIDLVSQTITNDSSVDQRMEFSLSEKTIHTSTFEYTNGFAIDFGTSFTAFVPQVVQGMVKIDYTKSHQFKWGETNSIEKNYSATLPVTAPRRARMQALSTVSRGELEIPFTIHSKSPSTGYSVETRGVYKGVTTWDLRHNITELRDERPPDYYPTDYFPLIDL